MGTCAILAGLTLGGLSRQVFAVDDSNIVTNKDMNRAEVTDASVLGDLHHANLLEIEMGKLAESKAKSSDVRDYGKRLVKDHTEADIKVRNVAENENVTLKALTLSAKEKALLHHLQSLKGTAFDTSFVHHMAMAHGKVIHKLDDSLSILPASSPVHQLVVNLLPTLQQHQDSASQIAARLGTQERLPAAESH